MKKREIVIIIKLEQSDNLLRLEYISVCQFCKENFNSDIYVPLLFKCGHFFCRLCIENNFTDNNGKIHCPTDGIIASSIKDLKLLGNLIMDKSNPDTNRSNVIIINIGILSITSIPEVISLY